MTNRILVMIFTLLAVVFVDYAQTPPLFEQDDIQSWSDLQLTVPMSKKVDFWTSLTMRFGKNSTLPIDRRYSLGFIYKPNKSWTLQPFFWHINNRNSRGQFRLESRLNLRVSYKFPIKTFGLSHRSWFEYRLRKPQNFWRYRPSLTFEKDLPKKIIRKTKFYITEEVFYDSLLEKFSRNRIMVGINKTLNKTLSVEFYLMRQNDGNSRPGDLSVIGTSLKIKL